MFRLFLTIFVFVSISQATYAAVPASITVQGRLTDAAGVPLSAGIKQFTFRIFPASVGGTEVWPGGAGEIQFVVSDAAGLWTASVGTEEPLSDAVFSDTVRWLEVTVTDGVIAPVTLPRVRLITGPFAFRVATIDGTSGGAISSKVSIGSGTTNTGINAFAAGESNTASGNWSSIPGGKNNIGDDTGSVVAGGGNNRARGKFSVVGGGGGSNPIDSNLASATQSTIVGGTRNVASAQGAFVGGGFKNTASDNSATIAGGSQNIASGSAATIGGGSLNTADGAYATVAGGIKNYALGDHSTIAGGGGSTGADSNLATGEGTAIGGGSRHVASGRFSTVSGGLHNHADGDFATIAGGGGSFTSDSNVANGLCAAVPGGTRNWANGNYSVASGRRAQALHGGTFVWGDSTDADFSSTTANQFIIRASNGVGIGTNSPEGPLHVFEASAGTITANTSSTAVFERNSTNYISVLSPDANERGILFGEPSNAAAGGIVYNPAGIPDGLSFRTGGNLNTMQLDAVGNLLVDGCVDGNNTACASDARFKKNIKTVDNAIDLIGKLRGVRYEWRNDEFVDRHFESGQQLGVIAQEVREVLPELVRERGDGYLSVEYNGLIPILLEAIKEQQRRIDKQHERILNLEKKLEQ